MNELLTWMGDWRHALPAAVLFVVLPSLLIRIVIRAWPKSDPRRRELLAEFAAIPVPKRLMWVLGVFELAWQEGLRQRREQSTLWPNAIRGLPGAVMFGVVAADVVGIAVVESRIMQLAFAIDALAMLPVIVHHVHAISAFADMTARLGDDMADVTRNMEADGLRVLDAWKDATARLAIHARRPRWCRTLFRIPLDPVPNLHELTQTVLDDVGRQYKERLEELLHREIQEIWLRSKAQLIEDLERIGADEAVVSASVGELWAAWLTETARRPRLMTA